MKELISKIDDFVAIIPALLGGVVDYLNQIHNGTKRWSFVGFVVHIVSALFFGWVCGAIAAGLGYQVNMIAAVGGVGGFLGVRVADLLTWKVLGADRRRK